MAIFQALDDKLRTMGEGAMTQVEVQYLIKECASVSKREPKREKERKRGRRKKEGTGEGKVRRRRRGEERRGRRGVRFH